jgi:hypothetical protein
MYTHTYMQCIHTYICNVYTHTYNVYTHTMCIHTHIQCIHTHMQRIHTHMQCIHTHTHTMYTHTHIQCTHTHIQRTHTCAELYADTNPHTQEKKRKKKSTKGIEAVIVGARTRDFGVEFWRGVQVVVVARQPRRLQLLRLSTHKKNTTKHKQSLSAPLS